jgi:nucleoside-diphosphate-sugar epimerase
VYVSSASAYADNETPGQRAADAPTLPAASVEIDDPTLLENYGPCKVACEEAVVAAMGAEHAVICRAGLIVGPEDQSGRFTYWPERMARGGPVLAPGSPSDPVQWVDVRDLAAWLVSAARTRLGGVFDGIGASVPRADFLAGVAAGVGVDQPEMIWVDQAFLMKHQVNPWAGPRSLPLWLPLPEYAGFLARDVSASIAAGLVCRDVADTSGSTLAWLRASATTQAESSGLSAADEADLLIDWSLAKGHQG